MIKRSLFLMTVGVLGAVCLSSCDDSNDDNPANPLESAEFKQIHITNKVNVDDLPDGTQLTDLKLLSLNQEQYIGSNGEVTTETYQGELPQVMMLSNSNDEILLMSRSDFHEGEIHEISAHTTAIALVTMHPALSGTKSPAYKQLVQLVTGCPAFKELEKVISESAKDNKSFADPENTELVNALNKVFEQVVSSTEDNTTEEELPNLEYNRNYAKTTTSRAEELKGVTTIAGINVGPFHVTTSGNKLIVKNYSLTPFYSGTVTHHNSTDKFNIPSGGDRGITFFFNNSWASEDAKYTFTKEGEYQFFFDKTTLASYIDQGRHTICNVLEVLGLPLIKKKLFDISDDILQFKIDRGLDIEGLFTNPNTSGWDLTRFACGSIVEYIAAGGLNDIILEIGTKKLAIASLQSALKQLTKYYAVYQACRGSINAVMRITMRLEAPDNVRFGLYYYKGKITTATTASLKKYSGDSQTGIMGRRLNEPVRVKVTTIGSDGTEVTASNFHKVKFVTKSGNGSVQKEIVATDPDGYAQTYWTLDPQNRGTQYLTAMVIDIVTGEQISEIVTFSAEPSTTANVTFTLDWNPTDSNCDIDLHIYDPDGHHIYYKDMSCDCNGFLDRDDRHGPGPEHIYYTDAKPGKYHVYVHHYESDSKGSVGFVVTTEYDTHRYVNRSAVSYNQMQYIGTLDVAENASRSGNVVKFYFDESAPGIATQSLPQK